MLRFLSTVQFWPSDALNNIKHEACKQHPYPHNDNDSVVPGAIFDFDNVSVNAESDPHRSATTSRRLPPSSLVCCWARLSAFMRQLAPPSPTVAGPPAAKQMIQKCLNTVQLFSSVGHTIAAT